MRPPQRRRLHRELVTADGGGSFFARGSSIPRFPFRWHFHPEVELTLITAGRGLRFVGDSVEEFGEGDLCLLGAGCPHTWYSDPRLPGPVRSLVVQFDPGLFGPALLAAPELHGVGALLERARRGLCVGGATRGRVAGLVEELCRAPAGSSARLLGLLAALAALAEGGECRELASGVRPLDAQAQRRLGDLFAHLHERHGEVGQRAAAQRLGMGPAAFSRFFRRAVGKTFVAYRNDLRIGIACRALLEDDQPITAVALHAGFANLANFNRRFRASKGMTPRDFRRLARMPEPA
jgi:AraC-like DNA-binding protein